MEQEEILDSNIETTFDNGSPVSKIKRPNPSMSKYIGADAKKQLETKRAAEESHNPVAERQRELTNERKNLRVMNDMNNFNSLSGEFDFIEESYGTGELNFNFYDENKEGGLSESLSENLQRYKTIGIAEGVFAPIGVMSRNNRIYDEDHYPYILEDQNLKDKISHRGMLGTIGHHDKKVDDKDLAEGCVSHIVTDLHIVEDANGTKNLCGTLEIMDTPAGHLLKTYYEHGVPLYVSSRGGGKLLPVANESYKRVDKKNYHLETFDIVSNPGFLQAKPQYLGNSESISNVKESLEVENTNKEETIEEQLIIIKSLISKLSDRVGDYNKEAREMASKEHSIEPKELEKQKCGKEVKPEVEGLKDIVRVEPVKESKKTKKEEEEVELTDKLVGKVSESALNQIKALLMLDKILK